MSSDTRQSPGLAPKLDGLFVSSQETDHAKLGYHHQHVAAPETMPAIAQAFRDAGYILEMITCQDRRQDLEKMRLVYTFNRLGPDSSSADRHLVHADVDPVIGDKEGENGGQRAESLTPVYKAADWMEREVYDMYGVGFAHHPDLKRILLPDDSDFHALLKDFGRIEDADTA